MATAMLLVVHGRSGGQVPAELRRLALALGRRRGAPVLLHPLTAGSPPALHDLGGPGLDPAAALTLVPLMLLPGAHVRCDLPALADQLRRLQPGRRLRRIPFLGAWPQWQQALRMEVRRLMDAQPGAGPPLLLHHPLEGALGQRYLGGLARVSGARCQATPYSAEYLAELRLTLSAPALPLALAANRLTDQLADQVGPPLLQRGPFEALLLTALGALP